MTHHKLKRLLKIGIGRGRRFIWRRRWTRDWEQVKFVPSAAAGKTALAIAEVTTLNPAPILP
ncbi:DUF2256 domain-containing protein [Sphingobium yanoikuyae]|jgi:hypothetical protein|uniref:DUF2256 domain-containing protein n=1 Tax=Sphingobium yanoikuyae TaxID=13690 RepID=UPI0012377295